MRFLSFFLILVFSLNLNAQVSDFRTRKAIDELIDFVSLPNFGLNKADIQKNIDWLEQAFSARGFKTQNLKTTGNPLFYAEKKVDEKLPTVLFYMHLDGQAVDPGKWDQSNPYKVVLKEQDKEGGWKELPMEKLKEKIDVDWRLFGRSASDDKGPIIAFLNTMNILEEKKEAPKFNLKVILDGEEEIGSKPLAEAVKTYRNILAADALIINDGPVHISGKPTLTFGCRGNTTVNMTIYGPIRPQHSGHYGNYAPNPVFRMAHLLASMKDEEGRVLIDGYYDGISLDKATKNILASVPDDEAAIRDLLQIAEAEKVGNNYQESLQYPSFNVRGISAGWVGAQARTIIPDNATVAIDMRLVPESKPEKLIAATRAHIEKQGYYIVDREPTFEERKKYSKIIFFKVAKSTLPFRTDLSEPVGAWLEKAIVKEFKEDPVKIRIMGGTVPIAAFINELQVPAVIVPMVNPDNNQHSPNENFRIGHLVNAMRMFYGIMREGM